MQFRPSLITRRFYLLFYKNKVSHQREKQITLAYQLIEAIISTEAREKDFKKRRNRHMLVLESLVRVFVFLFILS